MPRGQAEEARVGRRNFLLGTGAAAVLVGVPSVSATAATSPTTSQDWDQVPKILQAIAEPVFPGRDYLVSDFGAVGDGKTDDRPAIMKAIDKANADGGGRVVLPKGTWFTKGPIHLKSNINLHVSEGATLLFSEDPRDYLPMVLTRFEGTELFNYSPLIYVYQADNVGITGNGIINGNAEKGFATFQPKQAPDQKLLRQMGAEGRPVHERVFGEGHFLRTSFIQFFGCSRVLIEGVTLNDSPFWVNHLVYTNNATVRGVTVDSHRINNDGIDLDSCTNVLIENNVFRTGDDSVAVKSGRDQDGWRVGRPSENIVVRNNDMTGHNGLAVGSEMSGGVRNIFMENNKLREVKSAIYFKSNPDRGGAIEHVRVRGIDVESADTLLWFQTNYKGERGEFHPPLFRDFVIEGVQNKTTIKAIAAVGIEGYPIQDVLVKDLQVEKADTAFELANIKNFVLKNVWINGERFDGEQAGTG